MALKNLTAASIGDLDNGAAALAIDREIAAAIADMDDRGEDGKPRVVTIQIAMCMRDNGEADVVVDVSAKLPKLRTFSTTCNLKRSGGGVDLAFQERNSSNPNQPTLDGMYGERGAEGGE